MTAQQLILNFDHRVALGAEDFLVGASNRDAVAWIDAWPDWPGRALALFGDAGCGKTHLAQVWRGLSGAERIDLDTIEPATLPDLARQPGLAIEIGATVPVERTLLHLLNLMRAEGRGVLLLSRQPPARWHVKLPDLASRLSAISTARLGPPDDALFQAVLVKLFADRQIRPEPEIVSFLAGRLERSFAAAARAVCHLDEAALAAKRPITLSLVRRMLALTHETGHAHDSGEGFG